MQLARSGRVGVVVVFALVIAMMSSGVASAITAGVVESSYENEYVRVDARCAYAADLPDTDPQRNHIAFTATATTLVKANANAESDSEAKVPFATGVNCWVQGGSGSAGLAMVGPAVAAPGKGDFGRFDHVSLCVTGTVLYTDGTSDTSDPQCIPV